MIPEKLEDALNGGYRGLYGEVVEQDCYRLKDLDFVPSVVWDLGANIGVFTRYAQSLFPKTTFIHAVEPNKENCAVFRKFTDMANCHLYEAAIGRDVVFRAKNAPNGAHEGYLSLSDQIDIADVDGLEIQDIPVWTLEDLGFYWDLHRTVLKIDIEGNENTIWEHKPSMDILKKVDYIVVEIHPHVLHGEERAKAKENLQNAIKTLSETHDVEYEHIYLFAKKKWR